ncbi:hypothetical protein E1A91_A03G060500v1 [Gossypium mustelinum]|uniref:Uncharacterized protein n=1 Tax=Gossypium mustelinum TaxID=34275 RepID=A0A5D2ZX03_GOSMU|nr:hypothetical protein E1A91_A03G060500v1 [Gossypium mustelinum]
MGHLFWTFNLDFIILLARPKLAITVPISIRCQFLTNEFYYGLINQSLYL